MTKIFCDFTGLFLAVSHHEIFMQNLETTQTSTELNIECIGIQKEFLHNSINISSKYFIIQVLPYAFISTKKFHHIVLDPENGSPRTYLLLFAGTISI